MCGLTIRFGGEGKGKEGEVRNELESIAVGAEVLSGRHCG